MAWLNMLPQLRSVCRKNSLFHQDAVSEDRIPMAGPKRVDVSDRKYRYETQDFCRSRKDLHDSGRSKPVQHHIL